MKKSSHFFIRVRKLSSAIEEVETEEATEHEVEAQIGGMPKR